MWKYKDSGNQFEISFENIGDMSIEATKEPFSMIKSPLPTGHNHKALDCWSDEIVQLICEMRIKVMCRLMRRWTVVLSLGFYPQLQILAYISKMSDGVTSANANLSNFPV